jgi:hypothetical protein
MVAGTGGATMSGYSIFATMQRSWPFIAGWLVVFAIQIWCAAGEPRDILRRLPGAANDNQLVWPFIAFPEDWCGT